MFQAFQSHTTFQCLCFISYLCLILLILLEGHKRLIVKFQLYNHGPGHHNLSASLGEILLWPPSTFPMVITASPFPADGALSDSLSGLCQEQSLMTAAGQLKVGSTKQGVSTCKS